MNRGLSFLRTANGNICFSTNRYSVVCYHPRFVFLGTFIKAVTNPATKFCSRDKPIVKTMLLKIDIAKLNLRFFVQRCCPHCILWSATVRFSYMCV